MTPEPVQLERGLRQTRAEVMSPLAPGFTAADHPPRLPKPTAMPFAYRTDARLCSPAPSQNHSSLPVLGSKPLSLLGTHIINWSCPSTWVISGVPQESPDFS